VDGVMKEYTEMQFTTADIPAELQPKIITKILEERAPVLYFRQLCTIDRSLVGKPGNSITVPIESRDTFQAFSLAENEDITAKGFQELKYTYKTITVSTFGVPIRITEDVVEMQAFDVTERHIRIASRVMAEEEDSRIRKEMLQESSASETITGDGTTTEFSLTNKPILKIVSVTGTTISYQVDYYAGKIKFASAIPSGTTVTINYTYTTLGTDYVGKVTTATKVALADLADGKSMLEGRKYRPEVIVVSPETYNLFLKVSEIIEAQKFGIREPIYNGEVDQVLGMRIIVTTQMHPGVILFLEPQRPVHFVLKRDMYMERKPLPERRALDIYFYSRSGQGLVCKDALYVLVNAQSNAYSA